MFAPPGEEMEYSTGNTHLLSAILTKVTNTSTWQFANEALAKPLGFRFAQWPRDPQGVYFGGNEMLMTPRQMLAFGELYLNEGRVNGRQVVPASWVEKSCEGRERTFRRGARTFDSRRQPRIPCGIGATDMAGGCGTSPDARPVFAWGYGGQYVFVVPDLALVVVATSSTDVSGDRRGHRRTLFEIVEGLVMKPLAAARSGSAAP